MRSHGGACRPLGRTALALRDLPTIMAAYYAARALVVSAALLSAGVVDGHRSMLSGTTVGPEFHTKDNALEVPWIDKSWAINRVTTCAEPAVWIKINIPSANFSLYLGAGVPRLARFADTRIAALLVGPGLGAVDNNSLPSQVSSQLTDGSLGETLYQSPEDQSTCGHVVNDVMTGSGGLTTELGRCNFYENWGSSNSYMNLDKNITVPQAGTYWAAVWTYHGTPANYSTGKFWVAPGGWSQTEYFGPILGGFGPGPAKWGPAGMGPSGVGGDHNPRPNGGNWTAGETNTSICGYNCPGGKVHPNEAKAFYEDFVPGPGCPTCADATPPAVACSVCAFGVGDETCSAHASTGAQQMVSPTIAEAFCQTASVTASLCDLTVHAASTNVAVPTSTAKTYVATQLMSQAAGQFSIGAGKVKQHCPTQCPSAAAPEPEPAAETPVKSSGGLFVNAKTLALSFAMTAAMMGAAY